ncbi:MAG: hypothetical protein Kow006_22520 [Gammaproteobacteria bacterium]
MIRYRAGKNEWEGAKDLALDLTPLLDILFIVLVFFILTANSIERVFEIELPRDGVEQSKPLETRDTITVTLFEQPDEWAVGEQRYAQWDEVERAVRSAHRRQPDAALLVIGERSVDMERLLRLLAFLRKEGLDAAQIMVDNGLAESDGRHARP